MAKLEEKRWEYGEMVEWGDMHGNVSSLQEHNDRKRFQRIWSQSQFLVKEPDPRNTIAHTVG